MNSCSREVYFVATTVGELVVAVIFLRNIASWTVLKTLLYPGRRSLISPLFGPSTWTVVVVGVLLHESNSWPSQLQIRQIGSILVVLQLFREDLLLDITQT